MPVGGALVCSRTKARRLPAGLLCQRRCGNLSFAKERFPHPPKKAGLLGERARTPPFPQTPYPALSFSSLAGSELGAESAPNTAPSSTIKVIN